MAKRPGTPTQKYSDQVLEETPPRAAKLLNGIGAEPAVRAAMGEAGLSDEEIAEGGRRLLACWTGLPALVEVQGTEAAMAVRAAVAELERWGTGHFARLAATLRRHHPEVGAMVFDGIAPVRGIVIVHHVFSMLTRIDVLEKGTDPSRARLRKQDKEAVRLLAARGLDPRERARLSALLDVAMGKGASGKRAAAPRATAGVSEERRREARALALTHLKDWYEEWATCARSVVKKRSHLIRLGLARRKVRSTKGDDAAPPA